MSHVPRNLAVTLECFVKKGEKYLMLHRAPHKKILPNVWMAPGGHREHNEGLFECARREVLEETGLTIKNIRIKVVGNAHLKNLDQEFFFHLLVADYESGEVIQNENDGELKWLTIEEIAKLDNLLPELKVVLPLLFSNDDTVISYRAVYDEKNTMTHFEIEKP